MGSHTGWVHPFYTPLSNNNKQHKYEWNNIWQVRHAPIPQHASINKRWALHFCFNNCKQWAAVWRNMNVNGLRNTIHMCCLCEIIHLIWNCILLEIINYDKIHDVDHELVLIEIWDKYNFLKHKMWSNDKFRSHMHIYTPCYMWVQKMWLYFNTLN